MDEIILIERIWVDPLENRNAFGYKPHSFVETLEAAEKIVADGGFYTQKECWEIKYEKDGKASVYRYTLLQSFDLVD